jgi:release factor glutamine methyltransferase
VARLNARHLLEESPEFIESDLFENLEGPFDLILANPPYLTSDEVEQMDVMNWPEPRSALHGGADGLDYIRRIVDQAFEYLSDNGYLILEAGISQTEQIIELFRGRGYRDVEARPDLSGRFRTIGGRRFPRRG